MENLPNRNVLYHDVLFILPEELDKLVFQCKEKELELDNLLCNMEDVANRTAEKISRFIEKTRVFISFARGVSDHPLMVGYNESTHPIEKQGLDEAILFFGAITREKIYAKFEGTNMENIASG
jgi:hypothetical protein